ncbi:hypothetical protein F5884DRAFT_857636 [Xylogone sp. PMI_703]|nr:hypothetical protein F5884DRAFT_857636 [Xylogone sp. PMI_703]
MLRKDVPGKPAQGTGGKDDIQEEERDHEASQPSSLPHEAQDQTAIPMPSPRMHMPEILDMVERFSIQSIEHSRRGTFLHHDALPSPPSSEDWERRMLYRTQPFISRYDSQYHDHHGQHENSHHWHYHQHGNDIHPHDGAPILEPPPLSRSPSSSGASRVLRYPIVSCRRTQRHLQTQLQQEGASIREIRTMVSEIMHNQRTSIRRSSSHSRPRSRLSSMSLPQSPTSMTPSHSSAPVQRGERAAQHGDVSQKETLILDESKRPEESMEVDPENRIPSPEPMALYPDDDDYAELHEWDLNPMPFSVDEETMRLGTFLGHRSGSSNSEDDPEFGLGLKRSTIPASIRKYAIRYRGCAECVGGTANKVRSVPRMRRRRVQQLQQQGQARVRRMSSLTEVSGEGG